jgi:TetR/AcrR family transcriptional regulator, cholesterol catabolism regulator
MPFKKKPEPLTIAGQEMKTLILKTAVASFAQNSYQGTSMSEIASACGITKAGLYHYFKTKTDLLDHIYETVNLSLSEAISHSMDKEVPTRQRLSEIVHAQVSHQIEFPTFLAVFWRERFQLEDAARKRVRAREKIFEQALEDLLLEGQQSGLFRQFNVENVLPAIFGTLNTVYRWAPRSNKKPEVIADEILEFILSGISK